FAGNVTIKGRSKVVAKKGGSIISLENDFYNNAGIVMENGSDRASNEKFTDDDPQNGVAEAKAAMMEAIEAAIGAISAAIQGAIGKIGSCLPIGTEAQIETQTTNSIYPNNSSKDNEITSLGDMFNRTGEAFKEIGSDIYNGLNERRQKALDSPYDFVNYLTLGLPDIGKGILEQNQRNEEKFLKTGSSYDIGNWITFGSFDMIKGTFNPEKPFSKEHWMNSFATALMVSGGAKGIQVTPDKSFKTGPKVNSKIPSNTEQLNSTFDKSYGGFCFTSDTLIYTKDGYKYIKDLQIGDQVYSINKYTKEKGIKKVTNVFIKKVDSIIHIIIKGAVIKTTLKHQFWVVGKGWIKACELKAGYNLELYSGKTCEIMSLNIQIMNKLINVYNFEVEEWHTYYVSNQNILVHNICSEYVPRNPKWKAAGTDMWTWAKENGYELSFGGGSDIGKMFVKNKNGELIGEIHSGQIVDKGFNAGKEFQIHFEYYFDGTMKTDPSLHLYFED
ncbi:MAG: hypothetical protein IJH34_03090, partial [Romboutsia sp.]|nr:hypothetical protein [Romboutsia sp.]